MIQPLLIEIGVEELPAVPLLNELKNIETKWAAVLEENALLAEFEFYYTPRRLVLWHSEFKMRQDDSEEEFFGAPIAIAYKDGVPTQAAEGFARKCGVSVDAISKAEKGGKEVLYFKKSVEGQESAALLPAMIEKWIKSLSFGKSMRWGSNTESFIRPIRWVNVLLAEKEVEMSLFGVASAKKTYVHRMQSFDAQAFAGTKDYFDKLKAGSVTLFQDERRDAILAAFEAIEKEHSVFVQLDDELLEEVVAITEHPTPLLGSFDEAFLRLPPEVIVTSMKEHQRYFPVFKEGRLINKFVVVSNALTDDFSKVIEGNERVLRPRLADGLFFYDNDLRNGLSTDGLEKVVFMNGLGSLRDKIDREHDIADYLYELYGNAVCEENGKHYEMNQELLQRAIELAKADLTSEMVYEFTELQGLMGYYYAEALGEEPEVAIAIREQYLPDGEDSAVPSTKMSAIVAMAIKLDTLLGLFSINQIPTGSRDPFALRRAVIGLIRITKEHDLAFDINTVLQSLGQKYAPIDFEKLEAFFLERLNQYYKVNPSIVKAVLSTGERELRAIDKKIEAVTTITEGDDFPTIFSTFKRVANITKDVDLDALVGVDESLFEEEAETALYAAYNEVGVKAFENLTERLDQFFSLKPQLDTFFDKVMVNTEDEAVRNNRKALVGTVYKAIFDIADIKEITL